VRGEEGDLLAYSDRALGIGDEVCRLRPIFGCVDIGDHDICLAALQRRQQRGERDRLVCHGEAQAISDSLAQIDIETDVFVRIVRVQRFIARCIGIDRVDKGFALELRVSRLQGTAFGGRRRMQRLLRDQTSAVLTGKRRQ
jgi:hypothetical protein